VAVACGAEGVWAMAVGGDWKGSVRATRSSARHSRLVTWAGFPVIGLITLLPLGLLGLGGEWCQRRQWWRQCLHLRRLDQ